MKFFQSLSTSLRKTRRQSVPVATLSAQLGPVLQAACHIVTWNIRPRELGLPFALASAPLKSGQNTATLTHDLLSLATVVLQQQRR